jgi:hypothetical protein
MAELCCGATDVVLVRVCSGDNDVGGWKRRHDCVDTATGDVDLARGRWHPYLACHPLGLGFDSALQAEGQ